MIQNNLLHMYDSFATFPFLKNVLIDPQNFLFVFLLLVQPVKPLPAKIGRNVNNACTVQIL